MAAGVVAGAAGVAADAPAGDEDDDAPEVRCFLLFLAGLASICAVRRPCVEATVVFGWPSAPGANADTAKSAAPDLAYLITAKTHPRIFVRALRWRLLDSRPRFRT